jgi:transcription initiation factor IIF auxiliary subunit
MAKIVAKLVRDAKGRLIGIREIDIIHYSIQLEIDDLTEKPEKVIYQLHESYPVSKIEVKASTPKFLTEITSYGDYDIKAVLCYTDRIDVITTVLSESLEESHKQDNSPEMKTALEQIKKL